jgi:hypothetical protein
MLYDLSPRIDSSTPVWPGDTPYGCSLAWSIENGAPVNVTTLHTTPHLGSHIDAPFHFDSRSAAASAADLIWGRLCWSQCHHHGAAAAPPASTSSAPTPAHPHRLGRRRHPLPEDFCPRAGDRRAAATRRLAGGSRLAWVDLHLRRSTPTRRWRGNVDPRGLLLRGTPRASANIALPLRLAGSARLTGAGGASCAPLRHRPSARGSPPAPGGAMRLLQPFNGSGWPPQRCGSQRRQR